MLRVRTKRNYRGISRLSCVRWTLTCAQRWRRKTCRMTRRSRTAPGSRSVRGSDGSALEHAMTLGRTRYRPGILPSGRSPVNALQGDFDAPRQNVYWRFPRELSGPLFTRVFIPSEYPDRLCTAFGFALRDDAMRCEPRTNGAPLLHCAIRFTRTGRIATRFAPGGATSHRSSIIEPDERGETSGRAVATIRVEARGIRNRAGIAARNRRDAHAPQTQTRKLG